MNVCEIVIWVRVCVMGESDMSVCERAMNV